MYRYLCVVVLALCPTGCGLFSEPVPFSVQVTPELIGDSIPEQRCVLLFTVQNEAPSTWFTGPVRIVASAPGADVTVEPAAIVPGQVAEITVVPAPLDSSNAQIIIDGWDGRTMTTTIQAERRGIRETITVPITVTTEEEDLVGTTATEMRDLFIPWLAENQPQLGITEDTEWTGTIVTPHILVVTHYLFFSDEWEMHVFWHVMIPPYDWAGIELRRRFEETMPSLAFEIPSRSAEPIEVQSTEPSDTLWR